MSSLFPTHSFLWGGIHCSLTKSNLLKVFNPFFCRRSLNKVCSCLPQDLYGKRAVDLIHNHASSSSSSDSPLFLYVAFQAIHAPLQVVKVKNTICVIFQEDVFASRSTKQTSTRFKESLTGSAGSK